MENIMFIVMSFLYTFLGSIAIFLSATCLKDKKMWRFGWYTMLSIYCIAYLIKFIFKV